MNQVEVNVRDHIHGRESVGKTGISFPPTAKSAGFTVNVTGAGELFNCDGTFTIDFAAAATLLSGFAVTIANVGSGTLTLDPDGAETIDGVATLSIGKDNSLVIFSDGSNLFTLGGGALKIISNTAITAITNIDVTGFVAGSFDNYEVWISNGQPGNDGVVLEMETSTDGGSTFDTGASDYRWAVERVDNTSTITDSTGDTELQITGDGTVGNAANENINMKINVFGPEVAEFTYLAWAGVIGGASGNLVDISGSGWRASAADMDAFRLHWSAGDWAAQGNIQFLGIAQ